jgi:metal-responsive CopG/Arc/MetJ family transcriptional regulator
MKRTTISLSDELAATVEREARRRRSSVSEIVRDALSAHFHLDQPRRLPFESLGGSGYTNTARDMEEILAREWGDAIDRDR